MAEQITAHPLCWPAGWKRTPESSRKDARFTSSEWKTGSWAAPGQQPARYRSHKRLSVADGTKRLLASLRMMGVGDWNVIVSTNIKVKKDGLPYSSQGEPQDPGVAVYWRDKKNTQKCMAIDRYDRVADNLAAVAATLEAMRAIERHGGAEILDRAFTGFTALPGPEVKRQWWEVLGFPQRVDVAAAESKFRELAKQHHPDVGGDTAFFADITNAIQEARSGA